MERARGHRTGAALNQRTIYANSVRTCGNEDPGLGPAAGPNLRITILNRTWSTGHEARAPENTCHASNDLATKLRMM